MKWQDKQVLVTGSGGFIGSHLVERLVVEGARVRALIRYSSDGRWGWLDHSANKNDIEVVRGDVVDFEFVRRVVSKCNIVFHLAALIGIPYSYQAPMAYVRTNVEGTLNIMSAALEADVLRVVHTSTSEVYGSAQYIPIDENHPLVGQSPYAATKIGADKIAEAFHLSFGLPVVILRPFNTFGPRQSTRAVIPTIITQALSGREIRLGSLSPTRDMNFVSNTVDAFIKSAESEAVIGKVINAGSGREISIGELTQLICDMIGVNPVVQSDDYRIRPKESEVDRLLADNTQARTVLGWKPIISLEEGLQRTIKWHQANKDRFRVKEYSI